MNDLTAHRGEIIHFLTDANNYEYFADGLLIIENGFVHSVGNTEELLKTLPQNTKISEHPNCLITPGFVDTHVHYPQCEIIASYGKQLLEWLETYTFPAEQKFEDPKYASKIARFF